MDRFEMHGHYKRQLSRSMRSTTTVPIREFMAETMSISGFSTKLHKMITGSTASSADPSPDSPLSPVAPLALYVDAVPYAQQHSVTGC